MISSKGTVLCIYEILKKYSDQDHILSTDDIRRKLKQIYGVDMERRAIYRNIDVLRDMNIEIEGYSDNHEGYYLVDRMFEPSDVRLLCDAVAASDVISDEMSKDIMSKLASTQSVFDASMLKRLIYVKKEYKKINDDLFYNLDMLNVAINQGMMVSAKTITLDYDMEEKKSPVMFSPYATFWAAGEYYIIVKKYGEKNLSHIKVGKLTDINILEQPIEMYFGGIDPTEYAKRYIIDNGEHPIGYELEVIPELWEELTESFGGSVTVRGHNNNTVRVKINTVHNKIWSFVTQNLTGCRVTAPKEFREEIQNYVYEAYNRYW